jgi:hypothetical protein
MTEHEVIAAIEAAFADVPYPGDEQVRGGDDHTEEDLDTGGLIGRSFRGRHWRDIAPDVLHRNALLGSLVFMRPAVVHFYLPAFLIASLHDDEVQEQTCLALTPPLDMLTDAQREAIAAFCAFLYERGDLSDQELADYSSAYKPPAT